VQSSLGNWLILLGIVAIVVGLLVKTGIVGWFGELPGDIHIRRERFQFYFPITSMIIVSVVLSLIIALVRRFL
jgi:hypothetical protein